MAEAGDGHLVGCVFLRAELLIVWPSEEAVPFYVRAGFREVTEVRDGPDDYPPLELALS